MNTKVRSAQKSKRYPNLYKYEDRPHWVFRKYSKEKRKQFFFSTGETKDEARAYRKGVQAFDQWLGVYLPSGRQMQIKDIARAVLASKESKKGGLRGATYRSAKNQILNHIIPAFGHLRPDQMTTLRWDQYDSEERRKGRTAMANTLKFLVEILRRAEDEGMIRKVPRLKNHDPEAAPPKHLNRQTVRKLWHAAPPRTKLWIYIMWKQGPRPTELMQYRWDMFAWGEGKHGILNIPALISKTNRSRSIPVNSRVARVLQWIYRHGVAWDTQGEEPFKQLSGYGRKARRFIVACTRGSCLFPSPSDPDRPMMEYKSGWETACRLSGVQAQPYNLRDTWITDRLKEGLSSTFIGRLCDNSPAMIDAKYAVAEREAMERVAG